ncbi:50S ribosomal protein L15e [Candidatus Micrarchaeota archaeon]|nr:50S ribosomal protein L15e [Candidatus Micrarchaeota archaeon]
MNALKRMQEEFEKSYSGKEHKEYQKQRLYQWRREPTQVTLDHPTNLSRAHTLGFKAKQGVVVVRVKIRKGSGVKNKPRKGRKPSKAGIIQIKRTTSIQSMAEQRVARSHPNMEILNSYWVGEDGQNKWFEVILIDPAHPAVFNDKDYLKVITDTRRVFRGKTSAGKKSRGKPIK